MGGTDHRQNQEAHRHLDLTMLSRDVCLGAEDFEEPQGLAAFARVLGSLRLSSLDQVDNLKALQEIVAALERSDQGWDSIG